MKIRLCYASSRYDSMDDLIEDLSDILSVARDFNFKNEIYGVLYYTSNGFFQCLEGERIVVQQLFESIKTDRRHTSIIEFDSIEIKKYSLKNWSMKYVQKSSKVDIFFNEIGCEVFTPTALNENNIDKFLEALLSENQTFIKKRVGLNKGGTHPYL